MADRAEMFALSTFHSLSPPGCRAPQDISLEEFDDEDLSEITDDCGIGLNYDSDHYEKDCLVLERCEQPQTICSFQDDFQEFEMIDDNEEEEEEEEETGLEEGPPSPSVSPIPSPTPGETQKHRPTTLHLTATGTQDSLNNNSSSCNPPAPAQQRATWQETLRLASPPLSSSAAHAERSSPSHPCLQDGPCLDAQSSKSPGPAQPPCKPGLHDAEENSRNLQLAPPAARPGEDYNKNIVSSSVLSRTQPPPSAPPRQAPTEPHDAARGPEAHPPSLSPHRSPATDSYCARFQRDVASCREKEMKVGAPHSLIGQDSPLPAEEEPAKGCRDAEPGAGRVSSAHASPTRETTEPLGSEGEGAQGSRASSVRGPPSASSDTTSPSSDPGIEADLTSRNSKAFLPCSRHSEDLSSPGSDSDVEGEIEAAFACSGNRLVSNMISSISETELDLSSDSSSGRSSHLTNSIEEASSPGSEADLEADLEAPGVLGLKDALILGTTDKDKTTVELPPGESLAPLKIEEFYDDPSAPIDQTDVPLSGPLELEISPDHSLESLRRSFYLPVGPKLMPEGDDEDDEDEGNSEYDSDSDSESEPDLSEDSDSPWLLSNLVNKMISEGSYPIKCAEECFPAAHSLSDTISPASDLEPEIPSEALSEDQLCPQQSIELVDMETLRCSLQSAAEEKTAEARPAAALEPPPSDTGPYLLMSNPTEDTITPVFPGRLLSSCCKALPSREAPRKAELTAVPKDWAIEGDLDSGILEDKDMIDDIRLEHPDVLDVSTAKTNRCFRLAYSPEEDEVPHLGSRQGSPSAEELPLPPPAVALDESLAYDSIKYTLVVDENTQLELVSLKRCTSLLSDDSEELRACEGADLEDGASDFEDGLVAPDGRSCSSSEDSSPEADLHFSKKFLNVFVNSTSRSSSTESFGLFSCMVNGEEREQTHRAVFRFIPRHEDELELDVDDPILVELEEDDYWYRGYNMRTGERGIFPAFYAHEVVSQAKEVAGLKRNPCWVERFNVQFLGSVEVPYHQGNSILCAAMQKIATTRKLTVHLRPPATCDLEISLQGIKLILSVNEYSREEEFERCSHFFQMKNISFCGCHPRNSCYFGFITKHPILSRFACHVFVSQESMRPVAECVG
ncbi:C-Jun-amino-terminal kinase-interacting protein 2 [Heteronotia binoei]|uniref:C-Jun-amino-terminal kinase-interacting protein 2 n=1 Tax=Heteronotia binoei TaxID=13085 RepID=UPI00292D5622|nr:C-Jun-amino-terminal kinase-interacting protein 2 [Heteronotia binoei]